MSGVYEGQAWVFGDHVSTDQILPGAFLDRPMEEVGSVAMAGLDPSFARRVRPGDFVVAGLNFGCGSSREAAVMALKQVGVAAVVARSFGRIFFRNAINNGLPAAIVPETSGIRGGDRLRLDLAGGTLTNLRSGQTLPLQSLAGISREILEAGGIVPYTLRRLGLPR
ncbi:MAG: 3-isopropylmalate dehydratase small subunit [Armatimonadota bacterium]|nr:3-isopropylmalate dehydratase small subunit [Armatimonadota bacterium]MDR7452133.1 3-isopropylmalate dehydratase small subunit [Armatimonadota bacterium]MDR7467857.1 3-isopropylmalate dehydratase small subunit [Armatimonadota bacterium]MDR7494745.1 3-isopropylmalate dehydratase small subunit [Armatimonadota bacterium]MDR7499570.1 3-isopropylmalate dehydratase small subunit [Armatimonadota bacterium]